MSGLTNWFRANCLAVIQGTPHADITETWVNVLTALPTIEQVDGTTDETEWSLDRIQVNLSGSVQPVWRDRLASDDGYELYNLGEVAWDDTDTAALASETTCVGLGVYTASTGGTLIAYDDFTDQQDRSVLPGENFIFATEKIRIQMRSDL